MTANADGFIEKLEGGYEALVGEGGVTLSGGQQQRIAIARAILRRPSILILDEATSALGSIAEAEVQKGVQALIGRQTTLVIAHRLSTIRMADLIVVLEEGKVAESGTHDSLLAAGGLYARLLDIQALQAEPRLVHNRGFRHSRLRRAPDESLKPDLYSL